MILFPEKSLGFQNLDADGMIESILSKKQVFVKKSPNSFVSTCNNYDVVLEN